MSFDFIGCMRESSSGRRPEWSDPCGGEDIIGCMVETSSGLAPKLLGGVANCPGDKLGCMELVGGVWRPVVTYDEYNNEIDLKNDCCSDCDHCWGAFQAPPFIGITFSGITACPAEFAGSPNATFILPWNFSFGGATCQWHLDEGTGQGNFDMRVTIFVTPGPVLEISIQQLVYRDAAPSTLRRATFNYNINKSAPAFTCFDTNFSSEILLGDCSAPSINGYGGSVVIDWDP